MGIVSPENIVIYSVLYCLCRLSLFPACDCSRSPHTAHTVCLPPGVHGARCLFCPILSPGKVTVPTTYHCYYELLRVYMALCYACFDRKVVFSLPLHRFPAWWGRPPAFPPECPAVQDAVNLSLFVPLATNVCGNLRLKVFVLWFVGTFYTGL